MKTTFLNFLCEGGAATEKWNTEPCSYKDFQKLKKLIIEKTSLSAEYLESHLLGSSRLLSSNKIKQTNDIDIAVQIKDKSKLHKEFSLLSSSRSLYNTGTKIGSYAVEVENKRVQVDLMFVENLDLAKFMYHSSHNENSKYKGAVRNIMLMTLTTFVLENGKDFVVKDSDGHTIARASRSLKLDVGLERLFKIARITRTGSRAKSLTKVQPDELDKEMDEHDIDKSKIGQYSKSPDIISEPDEIAKFLFGRSAKASDIMTAEQVAVLINKRFKGEQLKNIKAEIKARLSESGFDVPSEL